RLDAAQSRRQAGRAGRQVRQRYRHETRRPTRGDRPRFRVHGGAELRQLHHRGSAADRRWIQRVNRCSDMTNYAKLPTWADGDHVYAVVETPRGSPDLQDIRRLPARAIEELERFFEATNALKSKKLQFL